MAQSNSDGFLRKTEATSMNAQEYAMFYAIEKNWAVFPLKPHDKKPLFPAAHETGNSCKGECGKVGHGFHDAVTDAFTIAEWWSRYPNAGIGIATGKRSGFFALDVDPVHQGEDTFKKHIAKYGEFPKTITALTGSGGHHYLFEMPDLDIRNSAGKLGDGIDTRGNGGYIATAPTIHPNGNPYKWIEQPSETTLAKSPNWLIEMLFANKEVVIVPQGDGIFPDGQKHYILVSMAGTMRRRGMTTEAIFQALWAENLARCVPPAPESHIRKIAEGVSKYPAALQPELQSRDRATAEWSFCKSIYESPESYIEYIGIDPQMFSDHKLSEYWTDVISGMGVGQAAANAEILTDMEKYQDYLIPRMDDYAASIKHFARMSKISLHGYQLQRAADAGDYAKIDRAVNEINSIPPTTGHVVESITDVADEVEKRIRERAKNPVAVWGIPYRWNKISNHTGGKQIGELTLLAGEPKIGKSYWKLEDVLHTAIHDTPVFYWCGEMAKVQLTRRFYALLGVNSRNMKTGYMTDEDWDLLTDAKSLILNSPLYIDDKSLALHEIRPMLTRLKAEHGIVEFVIDYASKINAPGRDEIEQSSNVSKELKQICVDLELAGTMIASVNKQGMDNKSVLAKSNVRGSGQQIHDADLILQLTTFPEKYGVDYGLMPQDYPRCVALNISAGRELEDYLEGGFIPYMREENKTSFIELVKK
jgi:putative DNA primase/helicase